MNVKTKKLREISYYVRTIMLFYASVTHSIMTRKTFEFRRIFR